MAEGIAHDLVARFVSRLPWVKRKAAKLSHRNALSRLKAQGFAPATVYDIGAYRGGWTHLASQVFPDAAFILFEANADNAAHLQEVVGGRRSGRWTSRLRPAHRRPGLRSLRGLRGCLGNLIAPTALFLARDAILYGCDGTSGQRYHVVRRQWADIMPPLPAFALDGAVNGR